MWNKTILLVCLFFVLNVTAQRDCSTVRCKAPPEGCTLAQVPGNCCNYVCPTCNLYKDCAPCASSGRCVFDDGVCKTYNRRIRPVKGIKNPKQCTRIVESSTCKYNGKEYKPGDRFPSVDNCNTCSCGNDGSVACTERACIGCEHKGNSYKDGESFKDSCNTCSCSAGEVICTEIDCSVDLNPCEYNGKTYSSGDSFPSIDGCNTCSCTNGEVACTEMACEPNTKGCEHKGKVYKEGETFKEACNTCACNNGVVFCTLMACLGCEYKGNYYDQGASFWDDCNQCRCGSEGVVGCTKIGCESTGCYHEGVHYNEGESFKDDCNTCTCQNGTPTCTKIACDTNSCEYNGKKYKVGESFPSSDNCNQCACTDGGVVVCTLRACAQ